MRDVMQVAADAVTRGSARVTVRGRTASYRFGTEDIRDLTDGAREVFCVRVYETPASRDECGHVHRNAATAMKCARKQAQGEWSQSRGASWVEILPLRPKQGESNGAT